MHNWVILTCIAGVYGGFIHHRGKHMPPFVLGRPPGGQLKTGYHHATGETLDGDNPYPQVQVQWFNQKLDHFNPQNSATWQQKFYYNPSYYKNDSLIFLMIGGEGPEPPKWSGNGNVSYLKWAATHGAMVFDLEHRFFGDSFPIQDMETSSLRLCTSEQALADIANFIVSMNKHFGFNNPRWITFGGSYPGVLSSFFRAKYPELTVGAVASSAPNNLKLDFYEYAMVVQDDVTITDSQCPKAIEDAWTQMEKMSLTVAGREQLNQIFKLTPKFDSSTTKLDITNFFANVYSLFQGMIQYTYDGQSEATHRDITARALCNIMTNSSETNVVKRVYNVWLWYNTFYPPEGDSTVFPNSYWDMIASMKGPVKSMDDNGANRGWMWLCCNELGVLQTTDQGKNIFRSTVPLNYFLDMCVDLFGNDVNVNFIRDQNKKANKYYNKGNGATNIVLPNGSMDPWHALGNYNADANNAVTPILINGTAHCADMYPVYQGEPEGLTAARATIEKQLINFMKVLPIPTFAPTTTTVIPPTLPLGSTTVVPKSTITTVAVQTTTGVAGQTTSGVAGQTTTGVAGQTTTGVAGQTTTGVAGQTTTADSQTIPTIDGQTGSTNSGQKTTTNALNTTTYVTSPGSTTDGTATSASTPTDVPTTTAPLGKDNMAGSLPITITFASALIMFI